MALMLQKVKIHQLKMKLKHPFQTSFGTIQNKKFLIVEIVDTKGNRGFGESVAFISPWYTEETFQTNIHIIKDFLIPLIKDKSFDHPKEVSKIFQSIQRNHMAKFAIEGAIWDLYAKQEKKPLAQILGGKRKAIDVGISLGMEASIDHLLQKINHALIQGYKRIKLKIQPGYDLDILQQVRRNFPDIPIMVDANGAYSIKDINHLRKLDEFQLLMIEQPFGQEDYFEHAQLQKKLTTPICLDESIHSLKDAKLAIELGSCKIINIKAGRVGGLTEAIMIHDYCLTRQIPVWCGGMLESGIGRAHNIALASLNQFTYPGDIGGSSHYWEEDIITPEVVVENGQIEIPDQPGIGYEINPEIFAKFNQSTEVIYF